MTTTTTSPKAPLTTNKPQLTLAGLTIRLTALCVVLAIGLQQLQSTPALRLLADAQSPLLVQQGQQWIATHMKWFSLPVLYHPLYTWLFPLIAVVAYVIMWVWHAHRMRVDPSPETGTLNLRAFLPAWNLFLTVLSGIMWLVLFGHNLRFVAEFGVHGFLCDKSSVHWDYDALNTLAMFLFAMSKFAELIDTVFHVAHKKPISVLHGWHHTSVLLFTWYSCYVQFSPGWVFASLNSFVHLYGMWFFQSIGYESTFAQKITTLQITQMIIGLIWTAIWTVLHLQDPVECPVNAPSWTVITASSIVYGSYLILFLNFYFKRYSSKKRDAKKQE